MKACILAIGSELLTPLRVDTNSLTITERLNAIGFDVGFKAVVGDDATELSRLLELAVATVDVVICTGGLGPTEDDVTRDTVAQLFDAPLVLDRSIEDGLRQRFARRGLTMAANNRRQAMVPRGATVLENPNGTAPGLWFRRGRVDVVLLPGPTREMTPMLDRFTREHLASTGDAGGLFRRVVRLVGRTESEVDALAHPVYGGWRTLKTPITTTILTAPGQIELHLTASARSRDEAERALTAAVRELEVVLGESIYSSDGRTLEAVVGGLLGATRWTIAVAESCTGGLVTSRLTDVPGSSAYVERCAVCYSNRSKVEWLGVPESLLASHGAVSEPVAESMARGIRETARADVGVGITGIAGPGGGSVDKPVGTVVTAVVTPDGAWVRTFQFAGGREHVKTQASQAALNMVRLRLLRKGNEGSRDE